MIDIYKVFKVHKHNFNDYIKGTNPYYSYCLDKDCEWSIGRSDWDFSFSLITHFSLDCSELIRENEV